VRVLITGGMGLIGQATSHRLQKNGWDVRLINIEPESDVEDGRCSYRDIMDFDSLH